MLKPVEQGVNRRIVLHARPVGTAQETDFRLETTSIAQPRPDQMLVRNDYLSLDPYMRGMMSDRDSYAPPIRLGETMVGLTRPQPAMKNGPGKTRPVSFGILCPVTSCQADPAGTW